MHNCLLVTLNTTSINLEENYFKCITLSFVLENRKYFQTVSSCVNIIKYRSYDLSEFNIALRTYFSEKKQRPKFYKS